MVYWSKIDLASLYTHPFKKCHHGNISMILQTRALWYRTFSKKLPTTSFLHLIGTVESPNCRLCGHSNIDTIDHFLLYCPLKQEIWSSVPLEYFCTPPFMSDEVLAILLNLTPPPTIRRTQVPTLYTIIATTHWTIWIDYWHFIIDKKPFLPNAILNSIHSKVSSFSSSLIDPSLILF